MRVIWAHAGAYRCLSSSDSSSSAGFKSENVTWGNEGKGRGLGQGESLKWDKRQFALGCTLQRGRRYQ